MSDEDKTIDEQQPMSFPYKLSFGLSLLAILILIQDIVAQNTNSLLFAVFMLIFSGQLRRDIQLGKIKQLLNNNSKNNRLQEQRDNIGFRINPNNGPKSKKGYFNGNTGNINETGRLYRKGVAEPSYRSHRTVRRIF